MIGPLIDGAIKRRKVVLGVTLIASIFGFLAYIAMPRESNPDITIPFVSVVVPYPGSVPKTPSGCWSSPWRPSSRAWRASSR
jgi:multidrug efflux pump